mmetsp:Transcript_12994/g.26544  ORF Transcript_12994/g.26544 Transcript_12994/m.26544 type:complete len:109 (-) Transcript_12994:18-344(-)
MRSKRLQSSQSNNASSSPPTKVQSNSKLIKFTDDFQGYSSNDGNSDVEENVGRRGRAFSSSSDDESDGEVEVVTTNKGKIDFMEDKERVKNSKREMDGNNNKKKKRKK